MKLNLITISLIATVALVGCGSSTSNEETQGNTDSQTLSTNSSSTTDTESQNGNQSNSARNSIDNSNPSSANSNSSTTDRETQNNNSNSNQIDDITPPIITISGDNPLEIIQGETFSDRGATATDNIDGEVTVTPSGSVDMSTVGEYTITYIATDSSGNEATATRTVIVKPTNVVWNVSNVTEFRQALENASANGENDRIVLSAGTYKTTEDGLGTFQFNDNEEFDLTIESAEGLSRDDVVLSGDHSTQVFNFNNTQDSTLIFRGVSIIDGNATTNGGGVYANHNIKIKNCDISNNLSDKAGGGFSSNGITIVTNSTISYNSAKYSGGGFHSNYETTIINSTISNNSNIGGYDNYGGGFYSNGKTIITNSSISDNSTIGEHLGYGGGFYSNDTTTVTNSIIFNNSSNYQGGGFYSNNSIVTNSTISNNNAKYAGGFYSTYVIVTNSILSENNATNSAIFSSYSSYISNSTFINNKGSISAKGVFINNIFNNNGNTDINCGDSKIYNNYIDYNKIEDNGHNVIKKHNLQPSAVGDVHLNSDNETLASDSPVIDKGLNPSSATYKKIIDNDDIYNQMVQLLTTDKVGNRRVHNETIDMGAVEYGSSK